MMDEITVEKEQEKKREIGTSWPNKRPERYKRKTREADTQMVQNDSLINQVFHSVSLFSSFSQDKCSFG